MEIRHIRPDDDRLAISRIYEESWRYAYRGIIPQNYLDSIPAGRWAKNLDREGLYTLLAVENDTLIGTASYCRSRFPAWEDSGEIVSIYLLSESIGKGYGRPLLDAAVDELKQLGFRDVFLWVLEDNQRAKAFYEKAGFVYTGDCLTDTIGRKELREVRYSLSIE